MDRVVVRSFRALDLAEQGIRALARSRTDSRRDVEFRAIGDRFRQARQDPRDVVAVLRRDAFEAPDGHFARLVLRPPAEATRNTSELEPRAVEARLEAALRALLARERPRGGGRLRHPPRDLAHRRPGACGARPSEQPAGGRGTRSSVLSRGSGEDRGALADRGRPSVRTRARAPAARGARPGRELPNASRSVSSSSHAFGSRTERATSTGRWRRVAARFWRRRSDRRRCFRPSRSVRSRPWSGGPEPTFTRPSTPRIREPKTTVSPSTPSGSVRRWPTGCGPRSSEPPSPSNPPGRAGFRISARSAWPIRARWNAVDLATKLATPAPLKADRWRSAWPARQPPSRPLRCLTECAEERENETPAWHRDRLVVVHLRVATGAEEIGRLGLEPEETSRVVQRAITRTYPFLEREGIRDNFVYAPRDKALDVRVLVPERLGWTADELRSPQFQQRFIAGFHQALTQVGRNRLGNERQPLLTTMARSVGTRAVRPAADPAGRAGPGARRQGGRPDGSRAAHGGDAAGLPAGP